MDALAGSHRVLSVDPLGNGLSDKPHDPADYAWPAVAEDVLAVLDAAEVDRAVVWGYSRGGGLAAALASRHPDRVSALVVHAEVPGDVIAGTPPSPMSEALMHGDFGPMWGTFDFSEEDRRYDEEVNDPLALGALWSGGRRSGITIDLKRITAPALIVLGGDDDEGEARVLAHAIGATLKVLRGLDHLQAFSRVDLVMPIVLAFVEPLEV